MVACGKIVFTEVRVHPIPPFVCSWIAAFNVDTFYHLQFDAVHRELPVIGYIVSAFAYRARLHLDANGRILCKTEGRGHLRALTDCAYGRTAAGGLTFRFFRNRLDEELTVLQAVCRRYVRTCERLFGVEVFKVFDDRCGICDLHDGVDIPHTYVEIDIVEVERLIALRLEGKRIRALRNGYVTDHDIRPLTHTVCFKDIAVQRDRTAFVAVFILCKVQEHLHDACVDIRLGRVRNAEHEGDAFVLFRRRKRKAEVVILYVITSQIFVTAGDVCVDGSVRHEIGNSFRFLNTGRYHVDCFRFHAVRNGVVHRRDIQQRGFGNRRNDFLEDCDLITSRLSFVYYGYASRTRFGGVGFYDPAIRKRDFLFATVAHGSRYFQSFRRKFLTECKFEFCL